MGIFLPLLQGLLFIVVGLTILSTRNKFARRMLARFENKYPDTYAKVNRLKSRFGQSKTMLVTGFAILLILLGVGFYLGILGFLAVYQKINTGV